MEDRKPAPKPSTLKDEDCLGRCNDCSHLGCIKNPCKQCGGIMKNLPKYYSESDEDEDRFDFRNYLYCSVCKNVAKDKVYCIPCLEIGNAVKMDDLPEEIEENLMKQKTLPRCARESIGRCEECYTTANFLTSQLPLEINMKSNTRELCLEYECMVEREKAINLEKKPIAKKKRFKLDVSTVDLTPKTLKGLMAHHHRFCLCSICKWCIITGMKMDEI